MLLADVVWREETYHPAKVSQNLKISQFITDLSQFIYFYWRSSAILDLYGAHCDIREKHLVVSIIVQNMVAINEVVLIV